MLWVAAAAAAASVVSRPVNYVRRREHIDQCYNLLDTNLHLHITMQMKLCELELFLFNVLK